MPWEKFGTPVPPLRKPAGPVGLVKVRAAAEAVVATEVVYVPAPPGVPDCWFVSTVPAGTPVPVTVAPTWMLPVTAVTTSDVPVAVPVPFAVVAAAAGGSVMPSPGG